MVLWFQVTKHILNAVGVGSLIGSPHGFPLSAPLHVSGGLYAAHQRSCNVSWWAGLKAAHQKRIHPLWLEGDTSGKPNTCKCVTAHVFSTWAHVLTPYLFLNRNDAENNLKMCRVGTAWVVISYLFQYPLVNILHKPVIEHCCCRVQGCITQMGMALTNVLSVTRSRWNKMREEAFYLHEACWFNWSREIFCSWSCIIRDLRFFPSFPYL